MQVGFSGFLWIVGTMLVIFNVVPALVVFLLGKERCRTGEHGLWILGVLFTSWLGFIAFLVVTTLRPPLPLAERPSPVSRALSELQTRQRGRARNAGRGSPD
ncbi:MAG: hypothetical protein ABI411_20545 [Tahibacter sp.]